MILTFMRHPPIEAKSERCIGQTNVELSPEGRAALISLARAQRQINAAEDPDLLASLFVNCWQGAVIRAKCDPDAPYDCLRFALDRFLGRPES